MDCLISVLGSGTIIPSAERKSTSLIFETGSEVILFDCGPSVPEAIVQNGFSLRGLDRVFITHFHPDHTLGLGHLFAAVKSSPDFPENKRIILYGPKEIGDFVRRWYDLYPSTRKSSRFFEVTEVEVGDRIKSAGILITVGKAEHGGGNALMYKVECLDSKFIYTGDTAYTESVVEFARGADILAAECSFPDNLPAAGHMTPSEVGSLAYACGAKKLLLLHMYPPQKKKEMEESIRRRFSGDIVIGADGMRFEL